MKELRNLSEKEFNKLKKTGLLQTIYPEAPETFKNIKGKRPKALDKIDWTPLLRTCGQYLDSKEDPEGKRFKDGEHYIFERAIECIYGSSVWDFINSFDE